MSEKSADVAAGGVSERPAADVAFLYSSSPDSSGVPSGAAEPQEAALALTPPAPLVPPRRKAAPRRTRASRAENASPNDAPPAPPSTRARKTAGPATKAPTPDALAPDVSTPRGRRPSGRTRESGVLGLTERARQAVDRHSFGPLLDMLAPSLPNLRRAIISGSLDEGLRALVEGLVNTLEPAVAQCWLADAAPWASEGERVGGVELAPSLRLGASAASGSGGGDASAQSAQPTADPLLSETIRSRRAVTLFDAATNPLAQAWLSRLPAPPAPPATLFSPLAMPPPPPSIGTLVAFPLRARGQFLGVVALATRLRLSQRQLGSIEELCDLVALAADRDRLLSYSRSQEALAQTVVRDTPVALAVLTGPEHQIALANPTFAKLLGIDSGVSLIGRRLAEVTPEYTQSLMASLRIGAVYASGEAQAMLELPVHQERGMTYWNVTSSPLAGGVLVAAVDVTWQVMTRQRAQEFADATQERIGQLMALHATTLATSSQLGADPHDLLRDILRRSIALLNARAGAIYVRNPRRNDLEVMVCQGLRGDYTGARVRVGEGLAGYVAETGQGQIVEDYRAFSYRTAIYDDEEFSAVIAAPLIHHGQVVGVIDVLDDAEKRVFADEDLWLLDLFAAQAAQAVENARTFVELESAYHKQRELDRLKDDFIAIATHELRTPLTGVQGFLELLLDHVREQGQQGDPLVSEFVQHATDAAQELADIAERLLQTSRLDTGSLEIHADSVRLAPVVDDSLRMFRSLQASQGMTHTLVAEVAPTFYVQADLSRLKEVLDNLVGNAIKYSPQGGRVVVRAAFATFEAPSGEPSGALDEIDECPTLVLQQLAPARYGSYEGDPAANDSTSPLPALLEAARRQPFIVVTVSDEGIGIAPEEHGRLFGRFSRMDSARDSQIRGAGLGLYICRQTMRAMGGDVWLASSAPGRGSVFAFALPAAHVDAAGEVA